MPLQSRAVDLRDRVQKPLAEAQALDAYTTETHVKAGQLLADGDCRNPWVPRQAALAPGVEVRLVELPVGVAITHTLGRWTYPAAEGVRPH